MDQKKGNKMGSTKPDWPWRLTATGELGVKREPMLRNELHLRNDLGKRRPRSYMMPDHWVYGLENPVATDTVSHALRGWDLNEDVLEVKVPEESERNFIALNKAAVIRGLVTAPEHNHFRSLNDIRMSVKKKVVPRYAKISLPEDANFGDAPRICTPIGDVIANKFGEKWFHMQRDELGKEINQSSKTKINKRIVFETRASLMRQYQQPVKEGPLWQLPRFYKSAKPHLETFRTEEARKKAMSDFSFDKIARKGKIPHQRGIYTAAYD